MSMSNGLPRTSRRTLEKFRHTFVGALSAVLAGVASGQTATSVVEQSPLSAGGGVPGNLLLVPSMVWPTSDGVANLGAYDVARSYAGYFAPDKCYRYTYSVTEANRHFHPARAGVTTHACDYQSGEWSGNYLNWAATRTVDSFRKALTGGYRVRDTATETWLEKARFDGNGDNYPNRRIPASGANRALVQGSTPTNWDDFTYRIQGQGNRMRFTRGGDLDTSVVTAYDPSIHTHSTFVEGDVYEVSIRVKVCDSAIGLEGNCVQYSRSAKPEGLLQKYSDRMRYSVFGYLNDGNALRDGGVLRARQKFIGRYKYDPLSEPVDNPNREWDPATGVQVRNPDPVDATSTSARVGQAISDSGVLNYINKFGQLATQNHENYDPVSELYYMALRYLKRQGNVSEYTGLSGTTTQRYNYADGFPVITDWDDPMQYRCQSNALLGIGDVNTHRDKNLPGNRVTADEPPMPSTVSSDTTVNVVTATNKVAQLEGITISTPFTGRENSAYLAGLAYDAHTKDLRSDLMAVQTASTYWVDVRENQVLEPRSRNQYWLAAKYGGFAVPRDFDPYTRTTPLESAWWSSGEILPTGDARPENFYVAGEADKMIESLTRAFARIVTDSAASSTPLISNSIHIDTSTRTFQTQFFGGTWLGDLQAFAVRRDGSLESSPAWRAEPQLTSATWSTRPIYVHNPQGSGASRYGLFIWNNLGSTQQAALNDPNVVDYLRGDRSKEQSQSQGEYRIRAGVLGDIVNSTPVHVGAPDPRLYAAASFTGANRYAAFATNRARRTPVVYVGANDGMLHGFNATSGAETYAFVPNAVIVNGLRTFSDPAYQHRYFVDGELAVADVYDTGDNRWKSILVGTLGRGGPGIFALDVTDPVAVRFLWEKSDMDIPELGKNIGRPVIAQVADGDWRVFVGNGPGTDSGAAQLVSIDVLTGTVSLANTGVTGNNALTAVLVRDSDGDGFADTAYAGDMRGNLWKLTGLSGTVSIRKIFEARDPSGISQPITAAPMVARDPTTGTVWVFFGTGRYLNRTDLSDRQVQTWYGIKDTGTSYATRADLVSRAIIAETDVGTVSVRVVQDGSVGDLASRRGWFMDFVSPGQGARGERMVVPNRFQGAALIGTTRIPEAADACQPTGTGYIMAIDPFTGARLPESFFDVTRDGAFNDSDLATENDRAVPASGIGFDGGVTNPSFVEGAMQVSLDSGVVETIRIQGAPGAAGRMSWREIVN